MIVISNSSPLIALSCLDQLEILAQLFGTVFIPGSVSHELVMKNMMPLQKKRIIQALDRIVVVKHPTRTRQFTRTIDAGEVGVLNLAIELQADLVLLDDRKARNEAKELGLHPAMTSAVLLWAVENALIPSYDDAIQELKRHRIYIPQ